MVNNLRLYITMLIMLDSADSCPCIVKLGMVNLVKYFDLSSYTLVNTPIISYAWWLLHALVFTNLFDKFDYLYILY